MASSRFPNKPLALINGLPMIAHCYYRAQLAEGIETVYVATCDDVIAEYISSIGGTVIFTSINHTRATTRASEALLKIEKLRGHEVDFIVMLQGDEPLTLPTTISRSLSLFDDQEIDIVNAMSKVKDQKQFYDLNNVKVVVKNNFDALYFSREAIPSSWHGTENLPMYLQTGVITFRRNTLLKFNEIPETTLEKVESIDMNRILETNGNIRMLLAENFTIGVDTPSDLIEAEVMIRGDGIAAGYLNMVIKT